MTVVVRELVCWSGWYLEEVKTADLKRVAAIEHDETMTMENAMETLWPSYLRYKFEGVDRSPSCDPLTRRINITLYSQALSGLTVFRESLRLSALVVSSLFPTKARLSRQISSASTAGQRKLNSGSPLAHSGVKRNRRKLYRRY